MPGRSDHDDPPAVGWRGWVGGAVAVALLGGFARLAVETPWLLFLAALLPAVAGAALVLRLDHRAHPRRRLLFGAFLWGAVVAPAAAVALNGLVRAWLAAAAGADAAAHLTGAIAAPAVEEAAKGTALALLAVLWRDDVRGAGDGIIYGALVGIGFTMAENLYYFALAAVAGGGAGLAESVYLRAALGGLLHPTFTATCGAGIGLGRAARRPLARVAAPCLGLALAVLQHVAWNAWGAGWLDTASCGPAAAACPLEGRLRYWLLTAPAIVLLFLAPGLTLLTALLRRQGAGTLDRATASVR